MAKKKKSQLLRKVKDRRKVKTVKISLQIDKGLLSIVEGAYGSFQAWAMELLEAEFSTGAHEAVIVKRTETISPEDF